MVDNAGEIPNETIDERLMELIELNTRKVPYFYEEGVCDTNYIPVEGGEIRVFHHKPKNPVTKRPILFIPGFGTSLWAWKEFSLPFVEHGEFFFLETREKKSSKFKSRLKAKMTLKQVAKDINVVIHHLGLDKKDYVLFGTSYCGGAILKGLIDKILTARTIVLFDPFFKLLYYRKLISVLRFVPPSILNIIRYILWRIALKGEGNETQRQRSKYIRDEAVMWKWRKASVSILKSNLLDDLPKINEKVIVFYGLRDKHHPPRVYEEVARRIPNSQYFAAISPEDKRELTCGVIGLEFCKIKAVDGIPDSLKVFEKSITKK
ncbi:MAG: alpha/beta fold hydrolase [Promethearchaeota archaeon]